MHETETGFSSGGNVEPLLPRDEDPLMVRRIELSQRLGEVLADPERYNSFEWFDVVEALREVTSLIRRNGVNTSRFHSSTSFPMRTNPGAEVVRLRTPPAPKFIQLHKELAA